MLKKAVEKISIVGFHILSALLANQCMTGIELSVSLGVTRGGITRAAKTLLNLEMIESYQTHQEKKKIYYQLTDNGRIVAEVHDKMHELVDEKFQQQILSNYSYDEQKLIANFLKDVNEFEELFGSEL